MTIMTDYSDLLQQVEHSVAVRDDHKEIVEQFKERFKHDINSPRRYEQIKSIGDLLTILEVRDILSNDDVGALLFIAYQVNNTELLKQINNYKDSHKPKGLYNTYVTSQTSGLAGNCSQNHNSYQQRLKTVNPCHESSLCKKERIMETIKEEIGTSWRDLGRNLKIREGDIEDIDIEYNNHYNKVSKLLEIYEKKKSDPDKWFFTLCEALEKSRRKDLSKSIQKIMTMNL